MTSSLTKFRLPEIDRPGSGQRQTPSITIIKPSDTSLDNINTNSRPQFIIKKVDSNELFEDQIRHSNFLGLSQINEENTGDLDEVVLPINLSVDLNTQRKDFIPKGNIFQTEMVTSSKYKEFTKGPVYVSGKPLRHTIVGSVENFERFERYHKKGTSSVAKILSHKESVDAISNMKSQSDLRSFAQERPSTHYSDRLGSAGDRLSSAGNLFTKKYMVVTDRKKNVKSDIKLSKDEVMHELSEIKERQGTAAKEEARKYKGKSLTDVLFLTKEERNLKKFEKMNEKWHAVIDGIDRKIERKAGESIMLSGEKYREKKEMLEAIDVIKTDEERYGSKLWMKTLRKYEDKDAKVTLLDLMGEGNEVRLSEIESERPPTALEVIRKPRLIKTPAEVKKATEIHPSRTAKEYIDGKFEKRGYMLEGIRPPEISGMDGLVVRGTNKLKLEEEMVIRQINSREAVRVTKDYLERKTMKQMDETLEKKGDNLAVIKHGLSALVK